MGLEPKTSYSIGRGEGILRVNVEWGKGIFFFNLDWVFFCFVLWSICRDSKLFEIEHVFCISLYTHIMLYIYHMIWYITYIYILNASRGQSRDILLNWSFRKSNGTDPVCSNMKYWMGGWLPFHFTFYPFFSILSMILFIQVSWNFPKKTWAILGYLLELPPKLRMLVKHRHRGLGGRPKVSPLLGGWAPSGCKDRVGVRPLPNGRSPWGLLKATYIYWDDPSSNNPLYMRVITRPY